MTELRNLPVGATTSTLAIPEAGVADELAQSGLAFGALVQRTGEAVAETQNQLNATAANSATALAQTMVDVNAVQERIYDDQGNVVSAQTHTMQLPLVNFIDPVVYEWTNVRLQGRFYAKELARGSETNTSNFESESASGQSGLLVILGGGRTTRDWESSSTSRTEVATSDTSYGQMRMNAMLRPRQDIGVPKPTQVIQGPRLSVLQGEIQEVIENGVMTGRTLSVLLEYRRADGTPIEGKPLAVETDGVAWHFLNNTVTDAQGQLTVELRRDFLDEEADTSAQDFILTARKGIVQNSTTVTF